jgi:hypothetical protein
LGPGRFVAAGAERSARWRRPRPRARAPELASTATPSGPPGRGRRWSTPREPKAGRGASSSRSPSDTAGRRG